MKEEFLTSVFDGAVLISVNKSRPGNSKKLSTGKRQDTDKAWISQTKHLLDSKAFKEINKGFNLASDVIASARIPCSIIKEGIYLIGNPSIANVDEKLTEAANMVDKAAYQFAFHEYQDAMKVAESRLSNLEVTEGVFVNAWNPADYLSPQAMYESFRITWSYLQIGIPRNLPASVAASAQSKLNGELEHAFPAIRNGLRNELRNYLATAIERLEEYGDGKRLYHISAIGSILDFEASFAARNLTDDKELESIVSDSKRVASRYTIEELREYEADRMTLSNEYRQLLAVLESFDMEADEVSAPESEELEAEA